MLWLGNNSNSGTKVNSVIGTCNENLYQGRKSSVNRNCAVDEALYFVAGGLGRNPFRAAK